MAKTKLSYTPKKLGGRTKSIASKDKSQNSKLRQGPSGGSSGS